MEAVTETITPIAAVETPSAPVALTTEAPSSTPTVSERPPKSDFEGFKRALEAADQKTATIPDAKPVETQASAATVQPTDQPKVGEIPSALKQGPIPLTEHQRILENARVKTRNEVLAQVDRELGWAKGIPEQSYREVANLAQRLQTDFVGTLSWLIQEGMNHPTYGAQMRAQFGGAPIGSGTAANGEPQPDVEVHDDQNRVIGMVYSDKQQAKREAWLEQRLQSKWNQQLEPIRKAHEAREQEVQKQTFQREVNTIADTTVTRVLKILDGKQELGAKVNELWEANPSADPIDLAFQVREQFIVPRAKESATAEAADLMRKKANGNTSGGTNAIASAPKRPTNAKELAEFMRNLESRGTH